MVERGDVGRHRVWLDKIGGLASLEQKSIILLCGNVGKINLGNDALKVLRVGGRWW